MHSGLLWITTCIENNTMYNSERNKRQLGQDGEKAVGRYLSKQGFSIIARNFSTRSGEIDLIAIKKDLVVFVEVKARRRAYFPIASVVVKSKQRKIIKTAGQCILKYNLEDKMYRFDVATVLCEDGSNQYKIEYIENAFTG